MISYVLFLIPFNFQLNLLAHESALILLIYRCTYLGTSAGRHTCFTTLPDVSFLTDQYWSDFGSVRPGGGGKGKLDVLPFLQDSS